MARLSLEEGAGVFHFHWLFLQKWDCKPRGGTADSTLVLAGSLLWSPSCLVKQVGLLCLYLLLGTGCVLLGGYPWLLCTTPFPWEGSNCCFSLSSSPPSGEEPGDLFYQGQTDVNSFSTKISVPLPPSQML